MTQLRRHGLEKRPRTDVRCYVNLGPSFLHCEGVKPRPCMGGGGEPSLRHTHTQPRCPPTPFFQVQKRHFTRETSLRNITFSYR